MNAVRAAMVLGVALVGCARGQPASSSIEASIWGQDSARVAYLSEAGQRFEASDVVVWTPPEVDPGYGQALADSLGWGVRAVEALVGAPLQWARLGNDPVVYYLSPDTFVSHATGTGAVFISWWRVEGGTAPFKHEALHEILEPMDSAGDSLPETMVPFWLLEGLPDYLAQVAAEETGLREGDVFDLGGTVGVDGVCRDRLRGPWGPAVLQYLPGRGRPAELMTTRRSEVAPTFYACANSLSKYLVERLGLETMVSLVPRVDAVPALEAASGRTIEQLRREWLTHIGLAGAG